MKLPSVRTRPDFLPDLAEMDPDFDVNNLILALISNPSWTVRAKIAGKLVQIIVDTGSVVSIIDETLYNRIGGVVNDMKPDSTDLRAAGGHSLEILRCTEMQLCVDSQCTDLAIVVAKLGLPLALDIIDALGGARCFSSD